VVSWAVGVPLRQVTLTERGESEVELGGVVLGRVPLFHDPADRHLIPPSFRRILVADWRAELAGDIAGGPAEFLDLAGRGKEIGEWRHPHGNGTSPAAGGEVGWDPVLRNSRSLAALTGRRPAMEVRDAETWALRLLRARWDLVQALAAELMCRCGRTLTGEEVVGLVGPTVAEPDVAVREWLYPDEDHC
jgi:hypothetical protein